MTTQDQLRTLVGTTAYDRSGDTVGKIGAVYYDDNTDEGAQLVLGSHLERSPSSGDADPTHDRALPYVVSGTA